MFLKHEQIQTYYLCIYMGKNVEELLQKYSRKVPKYKSMGRHGPHHVCFIPLLDD